jgi:uncharacterized protein (TIGR02996 family)
MTERLSEENGFLRAILANPADSGLRLVYADWLEERSDPRAAFVRLGAELVALPLKDGRRAELKSRLEELGKRLGLDESWLVWLGVARTMPDGLTTPAPGLLHLPPLNGPGMRMPRTAAWASFSHDGARIYTCGDDPHIWVWNATGFRLERRIKTALPSLYGPALHPTLDHLAAGGADGTVRIWDLSSGKELLCPERHNGPASPVCFADGGKALASAGTDGTVRLTEVASGKRIGRLKRLGSDIHGLAAARTGLRLGAVHFRGVRVWDQDLQDLFRFDGLYYHGGEGQSDLALPGSGKDLWVTFRQEPGLRIWNLDRPGDPPHTADLGGPAFELAFSPDEKLVAVALYDEIVLLLAETRTEIGRWRAPHGTERWRSSVCGLSFSPDGRLLTSTDVAGGIWVWPVPYPGR